MAADGLLKGKEEDDMTLWHRPTKTDEANQTLDIKLAFVKALWCDELTTSCRGTRAYRAVKEVDVVESCSCPVELYPLG